MIDTVPISDVELVGRTCAGDRNAFGELVSRHQAAVCAVAYTVVGDVGHSEDVAQEAFLAAWRQLGELRDLSKFKAWVCGIARNLALATARRERRIRPLDAAMDAVEPGPTPAERAVSQEEHTLVWTALCALPETYREPLVLFYRDSESVAEVATALELSPDAVKQRLARGREMLRADLAAMIEAALKRSGPGTVFTGAVLAALPGVGAATASAATMGGLTKASVPAAKAAASVGASAAGGALLGVAGAALGAWCSWQTARYRRERDLYKRAIVVYLIGLAVFVTPFAAMGLGYWNPRVIGQNAYLIWFAVWMLGFFSASGIWTWLLIRQWRRIVAEEVARGSPELPETPLRQWQSRWEGRQWTSSWRLLGLPLIDIKFGNPQPSRDELLTTQRQPLIARGWIALGERAYGVLFAMGNVAVGGIAVGGFSAGVFAFGGLSFGGLAIGGLSLGVIGVGGIGTGVFACAGMALGWIAFGGGAVAWRAAKGGAAWAHDFAIGGVATAAHANDRVAETFVEQCWFFDLMDRVTSAMDFLQGWTVPAILAAFACVMCAFMRIAYRRRDAHVPQTYGSPAMKRWTKLGLLLGIAVAFFGLALPVASLFWFLRPVSAKEPLLMHLDATGPYVILATRRSVTAYAPAIEKALVLHAGAERIDFEPDDLTDVLEALTKAQPRYALVFIQPDELDVNFGWRWLTMTSQIDDDPFVDVRTGFITGAHPEVVEAFVHRIAQAASGKVLIPGACVDNLGPAEQAAPTSFNTFPAAMMLPSALSERFTARSILHGKSGFTDERLTMLDGAGLVHFGGHGYPDRIDDGLRAAQLPSLKLSPCIVFNGACYTGVTCRWYDQSTGVTAENAVEPDASFCLRLLEKDVVGYLAALHPDHGMPVYQEIEYLAYEGASLGDVIKHSYDGVVLGSGGKLPTFEPLSAGLPSSFTTSADVMLKGTAARILFGDPALIVCDGFLPPPFSLDTREDGSSLQVTATLTNPDLKSTFSDTFYNDLNAQAPFNDRALLIVDLPAGWEKVTGVDSVVVIAAGKAMPHRLVGHVVERDGNRCRLHVQVDVPAQGFQRSPLRASGTTVGFVARR